MRGHKHAVHTKKFSGKEDGKVCSTKMEDTCIAQKQEGEKSLGPGTNVSGECGTSETKKAMEKLDLYDRL